MKAILIVNTILIAANVLAALVMLVIGKAVLHLLPEARDTMLIWFAVGLVGVGFALAIMKLILDRSHR